MPQATKISKLDWEQYKAFGGPVEEAPTIELLSILLGSLSCTHDCNSNLTNAGMAAKKPELYFSSSIDASIKCLPTNAIS